MPEPSGASHSANSPKALAVGRGFAISSSATILAGGGEFLLDFRGCPDGQKRLNDYFKKNMGGPGRVTEDKVKASGQLEFRPGKRDQVGSSVLVLVVESFSVLEAGRK